MTFDLYNAKLDKIKEDAELYIYDTTNEYHKYQHGLFIAQLDTCLKNMSLMKTNIEPDMQFFKDDAYATTMELYLDKRNNWMKTNIYNTPSTSIETPLKLIKFSQVAATSTFNSGPFSETVLSPSTLDAVLIDKEWLKNDKRERTFGVVCIFHNEELVAINNRSLAANAMLNIVPMNILVAPPSVEEFKRLSQTKKLVRGGKFKNHCQYSIPTIATDPTTPTATKEFYIKKQDFVSPSETIFLCGNFPEGAGDQITKEFKDSVVVNLTSMQA